MPAQGYDSVTVDLQHGMIDDGAALAMLQAVRASGASPLVRVPWLAPTPVMRAPDMGAHGVICPVVEMPAQAAELASLVRYPPTGTRSFGPTRAAAEGAGLRAALHCGSPPYAAKALRWGFDMVTLPNDVRILARGAAADVEGTRAMSEGWKR